MDENDEKTLEIVSKDFKTLQTLWNKFRQEGPGQTLAGRKVDFGTFFYLLVILLWITHPWVYNIIQKKNYELLLKNGYYFYLLHYLAEYEIRFFLLIIIVFGGLYSAY